MNTDRHALKATSFRLKPEYKGKIRRLMAATGWTATRIVELGLDELEKQMGHKGKPANWPYPSGLKSRR